MIGFLYLVRVAFLHCVEMHKVTGASFVYLVIYKGGPWRFELCIVIG